MKLPRFFTTVDVGFTLIELMVVVAIITIVTGVTVPTFSKYSRNQSLKEAQELFKSDLRNVQNKALTNAGSDALDRNGDAVVAWGLVTQANTPNYLVFASSSLGTDGCSNSNVRSADSETNLVLPSNMVFPAVYCVVFDMENGNTTSLAALSSSVTIDIRSSITGDSKGIRVSGTGVIRNND